MLKAYLNMSDAIFGRDAVHCRKAAELKKVVQGTFIITLFKGEKAFVVEGVEP